MQSNSICDGSNTVPATFREVKIGDTVYRLTSRFEGDKDLDATLERLAVKKITNLRGEDFSAQSR